MNFCRNSGIEMLDVVEADHHVVAHLEGEVQLLEFFARGGIRRFRRDRAKSRDARSPGR